MRKRIKLFLVLCFMLAGIVLPGRDVRASEVQAPEEYSDYTKVDVTKYGADRKGGKNAQNAFKNAVAAVEAMQEEGKKALVYLPSGTYRLDNYVAVRGSEIIFLAESDVVVNAKSAINVQVGGTAIVKGGTWVYSGSKSDKKNLFFANKDTTIQKIVSARYILDNSSKPYLPYINCCNFCFIIIPPKHKITETKIMLLPSSFLCQQRYYLLRKFL